MRLVELDAPFQIEPQRLKVPDGSVQLLGRETDLAEGLAEVGPGYLAGRGVGFWVEEEDAEDF